ncbi:HlyD family secretion protein [Robertkochia solimangrovi]|uniref:HlyD family secretion protein n=1 Tax=Robertkochia solimangrovi TaxID=2213046 RepID=UPI00117E9F20|nr:HlyD family secretion protein [Robertkochia solimangrovi]TRZ45893.1 HlyD family secretion protein [Robertkochia solimangrovi]
MAQQTDTIEKEATKANLNGNLNSGENKKKKNKKFGVVLLGLTIIGVCAGSYFYIHSLHHESTENAQVETNIIPVTARVSGYVEEVFVKDNEQVRAGDTLLVLDSRDYEVKVREAEAALEMAKSNLQVAERGVEVGHSQTYSANAGVMAADANIEAAKVKLWRAENDYKRYSNLWADHSITEQQYEQALAAKQSAEKELELLRKQRQVAVTQSKTTNSQTNVSSSRVAVAAAEVKQREAALEEAKLNLSYTVLKAKSDGQLSAVNIEGGQLIQAGQSLFNIVDVRNYWVVANFKETQVSRIEPGQEVELDVDALPKHTFVGKVSSFSPATGNKFALLPADNATGNFVKVVQKIPVKIQFDDMNDPFLEKLRAGMNVEVDVHIN